MIDLEAVHCEHAVLFYESDPELAAAVVPYLAAGARADEALVVIAGASHREGFEARLHTDGVDIERARAAGTLVSLDAQATLAAFMHADEVDPVAFEEVVGGVLRDAAQHASGIRAYGEMVALLWDAGNVPGAIELERLWNEMANELEFSLLCAYPAASVSTPHQQDALHEVCDLHSLVVPSPASHGPRVDGMRLAADSDACARARRFVRSALRRWGLATGVVEHAILIASELSANAVVHAGSSFLVEVAAEGSAVRLSVSDVLSAPPLRWTLEPTHGLSIVDALCDSWGISPARNGDGKTVWAVLGTAAEVPT